MITTKQVIAARKRSLEYFRKAGIVLTKEEENNIEVAVRRMPEVAE